MTTLNISNYSWTACETGDIIWTFFKVRGWHCVNGPFCIIDLEQRIVSEIGTNSVFTLPEDLQTVKITEASNEQ